MYKAPDHPEIENLDTTTNHCSAAVVEKIKDESSSTSGNTSSSGGSGYDGDESASCSSSLKHFIRIYPSKIDRERCGLPWVTTLSEESLPSYEPLSNHNNNNNNNNSHNKFGFVEDLKIRKRGENGKRMVVVEPKFVDYGSIQTTQADHHHLPSSRQVLNEEGPSSSSSIANNNLTAAAVVSNGEAKMIQEYMYQRQPLLPNHPGKNSSSTTQLELSTHSSSDKEYYDDEEEDVVAKNSDRNNGHIVIDLPPPIRDEPRYPRERCKTALAALIMMLNFVLTLVSLSLVHERVPDRSDYGPLPDVFLDNVPAYDWALDVSEYIIIICINSSIIVMVFHKHRWIVFRRIFLIMSLLYMYRAITMYVTVLPLSSKTYPCSPKLNETSPLIIAKRVVKLMSGFGLSVNGQHTYCGDFIYSGHTVILVFSYLIMAEYTPKKLYLIHWMYWIAACIGIIMLEMSHGHYSVDVVIAYFITTRIFWIYHTLANNTNLKQYSVNNLLSREWWFGMFLYFEGNVGAPLPKQYNWPLPWPRRWHLKSRAS